MNFSFHSYQEAYQYSMMMQYQNQANALIDSYDYNDIKTAMAHAKITVGEERRKTAGFYECMNVVRDLYVFTIQWLEQNGRRV